jgi:hypothetical protein
MIFSLNLKLLEVLGKRQVNSWKAERAMKQRNIILGFIGACAACCAIPLAAPLFGSAAISAALIGFGETAERGFAFGAAGLLAFLAWRNWRSRRAAMETNVGACGCAAPQEFTVRGAAPLACTLPSAASPSMPPASTNPLRATGPGEKRR